MNLFCRKEIILLGKTSLLFYDDEWGEHSERRQALLAHNTCNGNIVPPPPKGVEILKQSERPPKNLHVDRISLLEYLFFGGKHPFVDFGPLRNCRECSPEARFQCTILTY